MADSETIERARQADREVLGRGMQLIARMLRRAPREFALGGAGTTLFAIATVASSYVLGWATDEVLLPAVESGHVTTAILVTAAGAVLGVSVLRGVGITVRRLGAYAAQYGLQARDRRDVTDKYLRLPIEWHRRHPTGQLLSNVNADVESASFIAAPLPMAFGVFLMLIITAVLLIITDVFLAIVGFAVLPLIILSNILFQRRMRVIAASAQKLRAEVAEIAHESFDAALVVKTLGREDQEVGRFGARSDDLRDSMVELGRLRAVFDPLMEALPSIGVLAVLAVGAWRVDGGLITPGTLVTFAYLFRLVAMPLRVFTWLLAEMPRAVVGWERIEAVLAADETLTYGTESLRKLGGAGADASDVTYVYPDDSHADLGDAPIEGVAMAPNGDGRGVRSVTLGVAPGTTVAIVGPTGSGKTTIAHLMVRLFDPDDGVIRLDGMGVSELARSDLSDSTALVFQEAFLFDDTVRANVALDTGASDDQVWAALDLAQATGFVRELPDGLDTVVGERGASLSGGQRQRIALARAVIRRPRLLVLDDATSAVDPSVEGAILEGLSELNTTVVIVAYRRSSILLADLVLFVQEGRVIGRGTHSELYAALPPYADLIDAYNTEEPA
ncbi:MAG: ABC transporter ATP-binding protein [Acidimicrobiia bacterium]